MAFRGFIGLACVLAAATLLVYKTWQMRSRWHSPKTWALCAGIFFFGLGQICNVPAITVWVAQVTGVPNISNPLLKICVCAGAAAFLIVALVWRYPAGSAWPKVRWVLAVYGLVIVLLVVGFSLASVPEERPTDYSVYYATQPMVAAVSVFFSVVTMMSFAVLAYWCFTWVKSEDFRELPWLRRGLRLYGSVAVTFASWLALTLLVTVAANWSDTGVLSSIWVAASNVLPVVAITLLVAALVVPVWGPRWPAVRRWLARWRDFRTLRPLHRALRPVAPGGVVVAQGKRLDPHHRVRRMVIELNDWRTTLSPLFDPAVRQAAEEHGQGLGLTGERLEALVEAAQLQAAARAWQGGTRAPTADASDDEGIRDGSGSIDTELAWWIRVARAHRSHPSARHTEPSGHVHVG